MASFEPYRIELVEGAEGTRGWVRWRGSIPGKKGEWLGVEWDDSTRGKHSGELDGVKYFDVATPGSGSFVLSSKPARTQTFEAALQDRYGSQPDESVPLTLGSSNTKVLVFAQKVADFAKLERAGVSGLQIDRVDPNSGPLLQAAMHLDLSRNLLCTWEGVAAVVDRVPRIESLDLSELRFLSTARHIGESLGSRLANLRCLILRKTKVEWHEVVCLVSAACPVLNELGFSCNQVSTLALPHESGAGEWLHGLDAATRTAQLLPNLTKIDLAENCLRDWTEVMALARLPRLILLMISQNPLEEINIPPSIPEASTTDLAGGSTSSLKLESDSGRGDAATTKAFRCLAVLSADRLPLTSWQSVDNLSYLPSLQQLRLLDTDLVKTVAEPNINVRLLTLARLPLLLTLNGNNRVKPREVMDGEHLLLQLVAAGTHPRALPQRMAALEEKYGIVAAGSSSAAPSKKARSADVTLKNVSGYGSVSPLKKVLPLSMSVDMLKVVVRKVFEIADTDPIALHYIDEGGEIQYELDDGGKTLSYMAISSNGTVEVRAPAI